MMPAQSFASWCLRSVRDLWLLAGATLACILLVEAIAATCLRLLGNEEPETPANEKRPVVWFADHDIQPAWHSYVYWRFRPFATADINVDERGLRRTWSAGADARMRVFVFGGSTAWGFGARDEFTIPSLLAKSLARDPALPVEVTNFGQWAYVSTQELIALLLELKRGNVPDVVVFYDGINDSYSAYQNGRAGVAQNEAWRRLDFESAGMALLQRIARHSRSVQLATRLRGRYLTETWAPPETGPAMTRLAQDTLDVYIENHRIAEALAARYGFETLYYWQPVVWSRRDPTAFEKSVAEQTVRNFPLLDVFYREVYSLVDSDARIAALGRFRDLSRVFDTVDDTVFWDFTHITEGANERIAQEMSRDVSALLAARSRSPR